MLEVVGLKTVLDGVGKYAQDADRYTGANKKIAKSTDDVERASTRASGGVSKLGIAIGAAAGTIAASAIGAALSAITGQVGKVVGDASSLAESISKVDIVFGESAGEIQAWAKTAATSIGASRQQALEAAGTYGNLFQAFGVGRTESTKMSKSLVELAADLASFNNTSTDDALLALRSGLSGETEPLKRFGIALTDDRLKLEAVKLGIISTTKDALTPGAKAQAAYALIMKDSTLAQGDFARTSGGLANQQRILTANITNLRARIGTALLPAVTKLVQFLNQKALPAFDKIANIIGTRVPRAFAAFGKWLDPEYNNLGQFLRAALHVARTGRHFEDMGRKVVVTGKVLRFAMDVGRDLLAIFRGGFGVLKTVAQLIGDVAGAIARFVNTSLIIIRFLRDADDELFAFGLAMRPLPGPVKAIAEALRDLIRFVDRVTQPVRDMASAVGRIADPSKLAAGGIALFVGVLAAAKAVEMAVAVGQLATSFVTWPFKILKDATTTLLDFGKALLGVPSRKIAEEAGEAATGIGDDCKDKIARCIHKPEVDQAALAETQGTLDLLGQDRDVEIHPKVQKSESLKAGIIKGLTQGIGAGIGLALARALGAAIVAVVGAVGTAVLVPVLAVLAVVLVAALVGFLIFKFRKQIGRFFVTVGKALLTGLKNIPEILGGLAALAVAAFLLQFVGLPFLAVRQIVRTVKAIAGALADLGRVIGPPIGRAVGAIPGLVADALRELPRQIPRLFKLAVDASVKEFKALPRQILGLPDDIGRIALRIPGVVKDALRALPGAFVAAFRAGVALLPGIVRDGIEAVLRYIVGLPGRFAEGFRKVWAEVDRVTDGALSDIVHAVQTAFNGIASTITGVAGAVGAAARTVGAAIKNGIVDGFRAALGLGGDLFSALRSGFTDIINGIIKQLNDAIPDDIPLKVRGVGVTVNLPDNPIPTLGGGGGGGGGTNRAPTSASGDPSFGFFQHGTPRVPRDMFAFLHKDERVVTARDNAAFSRLADLIARSGRTLEQWLATLHLRSGGAGGEGGEGGKGGKGGDGAAAATLSVLPRLQMGTPFVPRDMAAFLHRGERVVPARDNDSFGRLAELIARWLTNLHVRQSPVDRPGREEERRPAIRPPADFMPRLQAGVAFVPRDMGAVLDQRRERAQDAPTNRLLSLLAGGLMARPQVASGGPTSLLVPITVYAQGSGLSEAGMKRQIHQAVERTFTLSRRRVGRAGRPLTSGTG